MKMKWKSIVACATLSGVLLLPHVAQRVSAEEGIDVPQVRGIPVYVDISPRYPTISVRTAHTTTFRWGEGMESTVLSIV